MPEIASSVAPVAIADMVLVLHVAIAAFIVAGQAAIIAGALAGVQWVRNVRFRVTHLLLIVFVAAQTALGQVCPLTTLEQTLRLRGGQETYSGSFTQHWLQPLIFFNAPSWVFTALHTFAAIVVVGSWILVPPMCRPSAVPR